MDKLDLQLKGFLENERQASVLGARPGIYPAADDFYRFIMDEMSSEESGRMLNHLRSFPEDQELVIKARRFLNDANEAEGQSVPEELIKKAKGLVAGGTNTKLNCPHCGKAITPFKKSPPYQFFWSAAWASLAILSLGASFIFTRYFLQFLALTLIFGFKWVLDRKAMNTQVLIYKALREEQNAADSKDLHRISSHL